MPDSRRFYKTRPGCNALRPEFLAAPRPDDQIGLPRNNFLNCHHPVLGCTLISVISKNVDATGNLDELRNPSNSGDQRIVPFLEENSWSPRQPLTAASHFGQTRFERFYELPSPCVRIDHRAQRPNHVEDPGDLR